MSAFSIEHYLSSDGQKDLYLDWLSRLRDRQAQLAIIRRINRIEHGNFGDHKFCREGVWELRIDIDRAVLHWQDWKRTMRSRAHDEAMAELYRSDPALALDVINGVLDDGDQAELLTVLRQLAQAFGGVQAVAERAQLNPTQLYRTLSPKGNPALSSLIVILKAMGLRWAVQPLGSPASAPAA